MGFGTGSKVKPMHPSLMLKCGCKFHHNDACKVYQQRESLSVFEAFS